MPTTDEATNRFQALSASEKESEEQRQTRELSSPDVVCSFCGGRIDFDFGPHWIARGLDAAICENCVELILGQRGLKMVAVSLEDLPITTEDDA